MQHDSVHGQKPTDLEARLTSRSAHLTDQAFFKRRFLLDFLTHGTVMAAAQHAGVGRRTVYAWLQDDTDFKRDFDEAKEGSTDLLEREAVRRAINGGDNLLVFLLKSRRREVYGDQRAVGVSGTIRHEHEHRLDLRRLETQELLEMERMLLKAGAEPVDTTTYTLPMPPDGEQDPELLE